ncbi:MAG: quinone-dependent dihydroorotate dehydrogenase [Pseudomonadota bacterium]
MLHRAAASAGAQLLRVLEPETAHNATLKLLAAGLGPDLRRPPDPRLETAVAGLRIPNPLGLAAGFDKNAVAVDPLLALGFGFVEVGAVTPRPQAGNPRPRVFRLAKDRAVINRLGFNNDGLEALRGKLAARPRVGCVGVNLGANKDAEDRAQDYADGVNGLAGLVDFFTVNVSSPNTPGLRALQDKASLADLLGRVNEARRSGPAPETPMFLKVAPDLTDEDKADIVDVVGGGGVDGLVVSNTTISRPDGLGSPHADEKGGLSGRPLFQPSTALLREFHAALKGSVPLIGVGGVACARDAYDKILAGASLVQLYTAMVYAGPSLPARIVEALPVHLEADGFATVEDAVGAAA